MSANDYYNNQNKQYYPPQGKQILLVLLQVKEDTILNNHSRLTMVEDLLRVTLNKVVTNLSLPHKLSMYNNHSKAQVAVDVVHVWQECACVVALKNFASAYCKPPLILHVWIGPSCHVDYPSISPCPFPYLTALYFSFILSFMVHTSIPHMEWNTL
ncbi:hypothetical protein F5878DRAFT_712888 [Lentinula raphanica]|uniref:Uncharacterized protein n=1 Tax=Lentinula raphanica TaxID=153919 RepID=A0AA38P0R8_9AGAR|nr:hypothetical protein F5878DRAFT_712888 [Lentinula raphanica]